MLFARCTGIAAFGAAWSDGPRSMGVHLGGGVLWAANGEAMDLYKPRSVVLLRNIKCSPTTLRIHSLELR
jgi:hypothetical protein